MSSDSEPRASAEELKATDGNQIALFRRLMETGGRAFACSPWYSWSLSGNPAWGSSVFGLRLTSPDAGASLAASVRSGQLPNLVRTGPTDLPAPPDALLEEHGFRLAFTASGMALRPGDYRPPETGPGGGLRIERLPENLVGAWGSIVVRNLFGSGDADAASDFSRLIASALPAGKLVCFIAHAGGTPAGASAVFFDGESAGVYYVAVEQQFRNRGIGGMLTAAATEEALSRGYGTIILQATVLGKPVYERLGYREIALLGRWKLPSA